MLVSEINNLGSISSRYVVTFKIRTGESSFVEEIITDDSENTLYMNIQEASKLSEIVVRQRQDSFDVKICEVVYEEGQEVFVPIFELTRPTESEGGDTPVPQTTDDLPEGDENLYFTEQRAINAVPVPSSTDELEEGDTNLYFTNQRAVDAVPVPSSTDDLPEGDTNLYFTNQRVFQSLSKVKVFRNHTSSNFEELTINGEIGIGVNQIPVPLNSTIAGNGSLFHKTSLEKESFSNNFSFIAKNTDGNVEIVSSNFSGDAKEESSVYSGFYRNYSNSANNISAKTMIFANGKYYFGGSLTAGGTRIKSTIDFKTIESEASNTSASYQASAHSSFNARTIFVSASVATNHVTLFENGVYVGLFSIGATAFTAVRAKYIESLNLFVVVYNVSGNGIFVATSVDGESWTIYNPSLLASISGISEFAYNPVTNTFIVPAGNFFYRFTPTNFASFSSVGSSSALLKTVTYSPKLGKFLLVYFSSSTQFLTEDGITLESVQTNVVLNGIGQLAWSSYYSCFICSTGNQRYYSVSFNGVDWININFAVASVDANEVYCDDVNGNIFMLTPSSINHYFISKDILLFKNKNNRIKLDVDNTSKSIKLLVQGNSGSNSKASLNIETI